MKNTRDLFRDNLREIISNRRIKLDAAAADCEISLSSLNQILAGKSAYSPETIDKICKGLNCLQVDLFTDKSAKKSQKLTENAQDRDALFRAIVTGLSSLDEKELSMAWGSLTDLFPSIAASASTKDRAD